MDARIGRLIEVMIGWDRESHERIGHNLRVFAYALAIAAEEELTGELFDTITAAAVVHDAGIRPALEKHGSSAGPLQEAEGREPAERMVREAGYSPEVAHRVAELIGNHHTYSPVLGPDHQILLEADLLVNMEDRDRAEWPAEPPSFFRTHTGRRLYATLFGSGTAG